MKHSLLFELLFMANVVVIAIIGSLHTKAYFNSAPKFATPQDLKRYREYVSLQMWLSIAYIISFFPGLLCGIYYASTAGGLMAYAPIILYFIPIWVGRSTRTMEKQLRSASISDPQLQAEYDNISYVWKKRMFPKFNPPG
ncbi:MAG: hypothetical protein WC378_09510 [Opitutaceae bacterium]|jgi:uncharacterized sodium:solute symporter family permease YidK